MVKVWVRMGDQGEYRPFDTITEAAEEIAMIATRSGEDSRAEWTLNAFCPPYGGTRLTGLEIIGAGYSGDNYVSTFWGDEETSYIRDLTDAEWKALIETVETCDVD